MEKFTIYLTQRNSDMTEGRGPMVNDAAFADEQDAKDYIDKQTGIMGRSPQSGKWSTEKYGDWRVVPVKVF